MPDVLEVLKGWVRQLIEIGFVLLALAVVIQVLFGVREFFPDVVINLVDLVNSFGGHGLVGLIAVAIVLWLFTGRRVS
jgi:hypothetical protein